MYDMYPGIYALRMVHLHCIAYFGRRKIIDARGTRAWGDYRSAREA